VGRLELNTTVGRYSNALMIATRPSAGWVRDWVYRDNGDPLIRSVPFGCGADVRALSLFADKAEELHGS